MLVWLAPQRSETVEGHFMRLFTLRRVNLRFYFRNLAGSNIVLFPVWGIRHHQRRNK